MSEVYLFVAHEKSGEEYGRVESGASQRGTHSFANTYIDFSVLCEVLHRYTCMDVQMD